ncbi:putative branched-chain amino acid transport ATP-binding protein LivG [Candidatus Burarchaeum australiense]|nr:putative branched-chain amino acid transport ATP-binding protein LivG [Candidatus Burarchaeum australiense]
MMQTGLEVSGLSKSFGGICAVSSCSLSIAKGKIVMLIGPNGAGKTTMFDLISGFLMPDAGEITINGDAVKGFAPHRVARLGISRTFQQTRLFRNLSIFEHIDICANSSNEGIYANAVSPKSVSRADAEKAIGRVGLKMPLETNVSELSYGQRKLLSLAMAIAAPHDVLLLDEPVAGVNPVVREQIKNVLLALKAQGDTIFVIEHDMAFVMDIADDVLFMAEGKIVAKGGPEKIRRNKAVLAAYLGGPETSGKRAQIRTHSQRAMVA